jgi:hypothetical protein
MATAKNHCLYSFKDIVETMSIRCFKMLPRIDMQLYTLNFVGMRIVLAELRSSSCSQRLTDSSILCGFRVVIGRGGCDSFLLHP